MAQFGIFEFAYATATLNPVQHFVGGYNVDIYESGDQNILIMISNESSTESFFRYNEFLGFPPFPRYDRSLDGITPGGTTRQIFYWFEEL
jgi:hypothetical protein